MVRFFFLLSLWGCFWALGAFAAAIPEIPEPGEDKLLTGGVPMAEFLEKRASANPHCTSKLPATRFEYDTAVSSLRAKIAAGADRLALLAAERISLARKKELISGVFECGECAVRNVERRVVGDSVWFVTDGSCGFHGDGAHESYSTIREFLGGVRNYPQYRGGLSHVLEFVAVDPRDGKILWDVNRVSSSIMDIFVSVRGPDLVGLVTSISYLFRGKFGETVLSDHSEFSIEFHSKRPTPGFRAPRVYYIPAPGLVSGQIERERIRANQIELKSVKGSWHIDSRGYMRYFTAADFSDVLSGSSAIAGLPGTELAYSVLSETLFDLSQIARGSN